MSKEKKENQENKKEKSILKEPPAPVKTAHSINFDNEKLYYKAETGYIPLKNEEGEIQAKIFFTAYLKDTDIEKRKRPITFAFNGGPGSSSVWLHLGALGPKKVKMTEKGESISPPYKLVDNDYTWLDKTDLVFIDPVTTGYSRTSEEKEEDYHEFEKDIESVGEFIRIYCDRNKRWGSPKFIAGESYGTTRAAGLSEYLQDRYGMYLNGIILLSAVTNFQTISFDEGNDLPYLLFLPTYSSTAWYHNKLDEKLQNKDLNSLIEEVKMFVLDSYLPALFKGNNIKKEEKNKIAQKLSKYTGLSKKFILNSNLRINIHHFTKELLRDQSYSVGRLDSRIKGYNTTDVGEYNDFDPSYNKAIYGGFSTCLNNYLNNELKYDNELIYEILTDRVHPWDYSKIQNRYVNVANKLTKALHKNPFLNVWVANAYYDLATPFYATEYTINHMPLNNKLKNNIKMTYYNSGHMMYINKKSLIKLKNDFEVFIENINY